jgi:hypothetical protein
VGAHKISIGNPNRKYIDQSNENRSRHLVPPKNRTLSGWPLGCCRPVPGRRHDLRFHIGSSYNWPMADVIENVTREITEGIAHHAVLQNAGVSGRRAGGYLGYGLGVAPTPYKVRAEPNRHQPSLSPAPTPMDGRRTRRARTSASRWQFTKPVFTRIATRLPGRSLSPFARECRSQAALPRPGRSRPWRMSPGPSL